MRVSSSLFAQRNQIVGMAASAITLAKNGAVLIACRVTPNASTSSLAYSDAEVEIRTTAQPRDGAANEDVIKQLAKALGVPKSSCAIVGGGKDRDKTVAVAGGLSVEAVAAKLASVTASS